MLFDSIRASSLLLMLSLFDIGFSKIQGLIMTIQDFLTALSSAYWKIDYYKFLEMTGFVDSQYSLEKFKLFQQSAKGLIQFDAKTLESLINTETQNTAEAVSV
ncbi:hypothetical protein A6S26_12735 [Nostoc sp. ATCC 43529]|nr:hypothetical protein A6S26_12735 [Nostoc sp. ATCC 43529]